MVYYLALEVILILIAIGYAPYKKTYEIGQLKTFEKTSGHHYISKETIYTYIATLILILFMGLRSNFAQDYNNYANLFRVNASQTFKEVILDDSYTEIGYRLLSKIIGLFSKNVIFFMVVIAAFFVFLIIYEGRREVSDIMLYILMFVNIGIYFLTFNLMRQGLAAAIIYFGTKYLREKSIWKYFVVVLIASTIHTSALFMILVYPLMTREINKKNIFQLIVIGIVGAFFLNPIISLVQRFRYAGYTYGMGSSANLNGVIVQWVVFVFATFMALKGRIDLKSVNGKIIINGSIFFIITSAWGLQINQISRLSYFFSPYLMAYGTNAVENFAQSNNKSNWVIKPIVVILLIAYMYIWLYDTSYAEYTFWGTSNFR